jgi:hypothetical protein
MMSIQPEQLKKRRETNKKIWLYVILPIIVIVFLVSRFKKDEPVHAAIQSL